MRALRLLGLLLALGTCGVESSQPLTTERSATLDKDLLGSWVVSDGEGAGMDFTIAHVGGAVVRVTALTTEGRDKGTFEGHTSLVGKLKVLNLRLREGDELSGGYVFVRYQLTGDGSLETWLLDDVQVNAALKNGTLSGKRTQYGGTWLTDTPARLVRYLTQATPEDRFQKFATLRRK